LFLRVKGAVFWLQMGALGIQFKIAK
jgi:hypothetical protein